MQRKITLDRIIRWIITAITLATVIFVVNSLSTVLLPFFIAWFFAYLVFPVVKFLENKLYIRIRVVSSLLTMILVIGIIVGIIYLIVPPMIEQTQRLSEVLTTYINTNTDTNNIGQYIHSWIKEHQGDIEHYLKSKDFSDNIRQAMPSLFNIVGQTASIVWSIIASCITLLYMFFILLDYEYLNKNWTRIFPKQYRQFWQSLATDAEREMHNYIRGQSVVSFIMAVMFCIGFTIIDLPMGISLGILIGILNLIPYLHTFAIIPAALLALLKAAETGENFWIEFSIVLIVFIVVQLISDMFVTPKIMGKAMRLNPAIILLSLSVWGSILGAIGIIIALPLTSLIMAYWQKYVTKEES